MQARVQFVYLVHGVLGDLGPEMNLKTSRIVQLRLFECKQSWYHELQVSDQIIKATKMCLKLGR